MNFLTEDEINLKLLVGQPIFIEGIGDFVVPTVEEIAELTETKYQLLTSAVLIGADSISQSDALVGMSDYQIFSLLIQLNPSFQKQYFEGIQIYIKETPLLDKDNGSVYFHERSAVSSISEDKFNYIKKLVRVANNFPYEKEKEDEVVAGNERAKKFMEELAKKRAVLAKVKKQTINLHSIISAVAWKAQDFDLIRKLTIYQLYDGYKRLTYIDNYDKTMSAAYSGNIDTSKMKLNELNWANIIQTK